MVICYNVAMTTLLKKAVEQLEALPKARQDSYASLIFEELYSELRWDKLFSSTPDAKIKKMEKIVLREIKKGVNPLSNFLKI